MSYKTQSSDSRDSFIALKDSDIGLKVEQVVESGLVEDMESTGNTRTHIFTDPEVAKYYAAFYEQTKYEGRHHFDPDFYWEPKEEKKVVAKTDWYVCFWVFVMFVAMDIDRFNIANAVAGGMLPDLNLTTGDYNLGNTLNLIAFMSAELPSQLISKKIGPDRWIPIQLCLWSIVAMFQFFIQNKAGFLVTRILIGALEGGFIVDVTLYMSYFYTATEYSSRIGWFYVANPLTKSFSSLLAFGIFRMHGAHGYEGWRWLFLIEGAFTLLLGFMSFFKMPPSAVQTRTWFRKKGWFTEREEKIMVNRVLRDDPRKGDMHNREALTCRAILQSVLDYDQWPIYITRLLTDLSSSPLSTYLPILLQTLDFDKFIINVLMIPPQAVTMVTLLVQAHTSKFFKEFGYNYSISAIWLIPCLAAMQYWPGFLEKRWDTYALLVVALGSPPAWVLSVSWCSANANSVRSRTVSAALVNMHSQLAAIIGSQMFRPDDAPRYERGTFQLFCIAIAAMVSILGAKLFFIFRNKNREKKWKSMSVQQQLDYISTTIDVGNRRLDFRFST